MLEGERSKGSGEDRGVEGGLDPREALTLPSLSSPTIGEAVEGGNSSANKHLRTLFNAAKVGRLVMSEDEEET